MCKVLLPLCCAAFGLCAGPKALWLVYPEPLKYGVDQERFLRTEFEVPKKEIKKAVLNSSYILSTIKYNPNIIKLSLNEDFLKNKEETYQKYTQKNKDENSFLKHEEK